MRKRIIKKVAVLSLILAVALSVLIAAEAADSDTADFVLLSEVVPDAILEIRYYSTYNFVGERIDGYKEPVALLSREAAEALRAVSDDLLPRGYRLKVYDAYRPQSAVDHFLRWAQNLDDTRMKSYFYPELDKSVLFSQGYVSSKSGHSRGSTVDLTLFDISSGREVDMGGTFDYFGERSHSDYAGISEEQRANRMILRDVMLAHGFKGISTEWWHYTLIDEPYKNSYFDFPVAVASIQSPNTEKADVEQPQVLVEGMQGAEVRELQELLIITGYLVDSADGAFGPKTKRAVMNLQIVNRLCISGEAGEVEMEALLREAMAVLDELIAKKLIETGLDGRMEGVSATFEFVFDGSWSRGLDGTWNVIGALVRFPENKLYALVSYRVFIKGTELAINIDELSILAEQ